MPILCPVSLPVASANAAAPAWSKERLTTLSPVFGSRTASLPLTSFPSTSTFPFSSRKVSRAVSPSSAIASSGLKFFSSDFQGKRTMTWPAFLSTVTSLSRIFLASSLPSITSLADSSSPSDGR